MRTCAEVVPSRSRSISLGKSAASRCRFSLSETGQAVEWVWAQEGEQESTQDSVQEGERAPPRGRRGGLEIGREEGGVWIRGEWVRVEAIWEDEEEVVVVVEVVEVVFAGDFGGDEAVMLFTKGVARAAEYREEGEEGEGEGFEAASGSVASSPSRLTCVTSGSGGGS